MHRDTGTALCEVIRFGRAYSNVEIAKGLTDRQSSRNQNDAWHWQALFYTCISVTDQRLDIMCKHNPVFLCSPFKDYWIRCLIEFGILYTYNIKIGETLTQSFEEVPVEVFISGEAHQAS